jgi:hypothetical protein
MSSLLYWCGTLSGRTSLASFYRNNSSNLTSQLLPVSCQSRGHAAPDFLRVIDYRCKPVRQQPHIKIPDIHAVARQFDICHQFGDLRMMRYRENGLV